MEHYEALGYKNFNFGWVVRTDGSGMPDISYPGDVWSGLKIDDVSVDVEVAGNTVWESETKYVHLEPGESETVEFTWNTTDYSFYIIEGRTLLEGDCNGENNYAINSTYLYDQAYLDDIEHGNKNWETEDNTIKTPSPYASICDNGACDWELDHYWYLGDPERDNDNSGYPANADIVLQIVNPETEDGSFDLVNYSDATLDFKLWNEMEQYWDYFSLEVSNDSGQNWWTIAHWYNMSNEDWNEEEWQNIHIVLFNHSATPPIDTITGYDFYWPYYGSYEYYHYVDIGITNKMHFRFHLLSDVAYQLKGVYIDDVYLNTSENKSIPWDGHDFAPDEHNWTWEITTLFHDDMEDAAASAEKWISYDGAPVGDKWHRTNECYHSYNTSWWCADIDPWSTYGKHLDLAKEDYFWFLIPENGWELWAYARYLTYYHSPMMYRMNMENNLTLTVDLSDKYQAFLMYWENYTFADRNDYGLLKLSKDGGQTWIEIGGTEGLTSNGWKQRKFDITFMLPAVLQIRWEFISNETGSDIGWEIDDINITAKPDCQEPTTTCIFNPPIPDGNNGWYVSPVEVTLVAKDDKKVAETYYSIDGGNWTLYTSPFSVSADGLHTITYYSIDHVGNAEDIKSCTFKIDKTAPIGSIDMPKAGYIYLLGRELMPRIFIKDKALIIGGLKATATATDDTSGMYYVTFTTSKGTIEDAIKPYEFNLPFYFPFGSDTLSVTITDFAGNSASAGSTDYLKIL
ncbi:hypothetical protein DRZ77_03430 [Candidatus Woesearchaeota archaeon]|nr:MAG: hypothetical protein DRZ77_03430 [Candidatus Woesearchaeota archaeon]